MDDICIYDQNKSPPGHKTSQYWEKTKAAIFQRKPDVVARTQALKGYNNPCSMSPLSRCELEPQTKLDKAQQSVEIIDSRETTTEIVSLLKSKITSFQILRRPRVGFHPKILDGTSAGCPE